MKLYMCDICGKPISFVRRINTKTESVPMYNIPPDQSITPVLSGMDICNSCYNEMQSCVIEKIRQIHQEKQRKMDKNLSFRIANAEGSVKKI